VLEALRPPQVQPATRFLVALRTERWKLLREFGSDGRVRSAPKPCTTWPRIRASSAPW
jgi:hypothetical protein